MKKQILILVMVISSVICQLGTAQQLFVPGNNSTNPGIGTSTSGNVGVGIQYAQEKLTVNGNIQVSPSSNIAGGFIGKYCFAPGGGVFVNPSAYMGAVYENGTWWYGAGLVFATSSGPDITNNSSAIERMRIDKYGRVGIGTDIPNNILHLKTSSGAIAMTLQTGTSYSYLCNDGNNIILASDLGTTGYKLLVSRSAPDNSLIINSVGNVGIGTTSPGTKLDVIGTIRAQEVKVCLSQGCDFVFKNDYKLMDLKTLESFVTTNQHLPEIASEKEMVENGVNMKEMQMKLLQKIEELTLYTIEQNKKITELEKQNAKIQALEKKVEELASALK